MFQSEPEPEPEGSEARGLGFLPEHAVEFSDKIIGRGGQGIVTEGRYTAPDGTTRAVAIKKLADGATDREEAQFLKEFETHKRASRNCDKACTLYGCVYRGAALCLVMERYERSLYQFLDERRDPSVPDDPKVPAVQAALMANEIAHGLSQLHKQSIVCADLKPGNVLMDHDGGLVISDFGLAVMVDRSIMRSTTSSGVGAGTARYMAPEQHSSEDFGSLSTKADLWALGCIVVEMLTGEPVWSGKRPLEIMMNVAGKGKSPPVPDGLPDELQAAAVGVTAGGWP
jgi:serine/threonine protein kinase